jgi:hypothetical protein
MGCGTFEANVMCYGYYISSGDSWKEETSRVCQQVKNKNIKIPGTICFQWNNNLSLLLASLNKLMLGECWYQIWASYIDWVEINAESYPSMAILEVITAESLQIRTKVDLEFFICWYFWGKKYVNIKSRNCFLSSESCPFTKTEHAGSIENCPLKYQISIQNLPATWTRGHRRTLTWTWATSYKNLRASND